MDYLIPPNNAYAGMMVNHQTRGHHGHSVKYGQPGQPGQSDPPGTMRYDGLSTIHDNNVAVDVGHHTENPVSIIINSADRNYSKYPDANQYVLDLTKVYKRVTGIKLQNLSIPISEYNVTQYNNILRFDDNSNEFSITVEPGEYTISELCTEIQVLMNAVVGITGTYAVSVNTNTKLVQISRAGGTGTFKLLFDGGSVKYGTQYVDRADFDQSTTITYGDSHNEHYPYSIARLIGFKPADYTGSSVYKAPNTYNMEPTQFIVIKIRGFERIESTSPHIDGAFAVMFTGNSGSLYNNLDSDASDKAQCNIVFNPPKEKLDKLDVSITDEFGNPYFFTGKEHAICIDIMTLSRNGRFRA